MLSRVADSLYWLSRYIERAENLTRLVDVNRRESLDTINIHSGEDPSLRLIKTTSTEKAYFAAKENAGGELDVGEFITFSDGNPDSIKGCIAHARENARMVRDQISGEMWLELNSAHLFLQSPDTLKLWRRQPESFSREVITFSLQFQGLTDATILHDEGWQFVQFGKFIERADKTSRILDTLTYLAKPDRSELSSVLRSCSGFSAFRREFRGEVTFKNAVKFLLFSAAFPRSVRFCVRQMDQILHAISGVPIGTFSNEAERMTGSLLAQMNFTSPETVMDEGLHEYIDQIQWQLNEIGQNVFETYVLLPLEVQNLAQNSLLSLQLSQQQQQQ